MSLALERLLDEGALRRCAEIYAQGADHRDKAAWRAILADDVIIEGPGFRIEGLEQNLASLDMLGQMFRTTAHRITGQVVSIDGDHAEGETMGLAEHLLRDRDAILVWSIRYQDAWRREGGSWRFRHRRLLLDWQETRDVLIEKEGQ